MKSIKWIMKPIGNLLGIGSHLTDPAQFSIKKEKHYLYQIESAMQYVFVDERSGKYTDTDEDKAKKLKTHFRKRIFDVL
jgi:hypothetical protein